MKRLFFAVAATLALLCSGCLRDLLPTDQVVNADEFLGQPEVSGKTYTGLEPRTDYPIMPFKVWSLRIVDEVLSEVAGHDRWWMLEAAQVELTDGSRHWFTIDTENDGTQYLGIPNPVLRPLADVFPSVKYDNELKVKTSEFGDRRVYVFKYNLPDKTPVYLEVAADIEMEPPSSRNGNGMNHSANISLLLIDLAGLSHGRGKVKFGGELMPLREIAGFYERTFRIAQTCGGLAIGDVEMEANYTSGSIYITRGGVKGTYEVFNKPTFFMMRSNGLAAVEEVFFLKSGKALELSRITQKQGEVETFDMRFNPALPDLRYAFEETYKTKVVIGINGQSGYMFGDAIVTPIDEGYAVMIRPHEPRWAKARPIEARIIFTPQRTVEINNYLLDPDIAWDDKYRPRNAEEIAAARAEAEKIAAEKAAALIEEASEEKAEAVEAPAEEELEEAVVEVEAVEGDTEATPETK